MIGRRGYLTASYYDDCSRDRFNTCGLTSSGAVFHADDPDNAASPIFPDGTIILAYNPASKMAAILRVTSAGPYHGDRKLDVSRSAAERLGFIKSGVAELIVTVLKSPSEQDARYKKLRIYDKVPGPIGRFESFELAERTAIKTMTMQADLKVVASYQSAALGQQLATPQADNVPDLKKMPGPENRDAFQWTEAKLVTPADIVDAVPPLTRLETLKQTEIMSAREEDIGTPALETFWRFIEAARVAARSPSARFGPDIHIPASRNDETLFERLKRFLADAQIQARRPRAPGHSVLATAAE